MPVSLVTTVMRKIADASSRQDLEALEKLTRIAKRVRQIEEQQQSIATELDQIREMLSSNLEEIELSSDVGAARKKGLRITIDWRSAGQNRDTAKIENAKGSRALVGFLSEIHSVLGEAALAKLATLRISRGPLVSTHPERDFINHGDGSVYAHHQIPDTPYSVITHSGTTEKMEAMRAAARLIGLKNAIAIERI